MRFIRIDHIGIAVRDLLAAIATYTRLHGMAPTHQCTVPAEGVAAAMFPVGPTKIELLAPLSEASPIAGFLAKRGEGMHHLCYLVADLAAAQRELAHEGFTPIARPAGPGAAGQAISFFHPRDTHGVLIELIQAPFSK